jgi:hypothetical protein
MNIREFNQRFLEPGSQWAMVLGIIFLCQPWFEVLPKPVKKVDADDTGPVPVTQVVRGGSGHG